MRYCVYLTVYRGNKMPPFYIGSTNVDKHQSGYCGSVKSKLYRSTWEQELRENRHLFHSHIISMHDTREEALKKEEQLHRYFLVHRNELYINQATAHGAFGMLGQKKGFQHSDETKEFLRQKRLMQVIPKECYLKTSQKLLGKKRRLITCPHCKKQGAEGAMQRWHFTNCRVFSSTLHAA